MNSENLQNKTDDYIQLYDELRRSMKWKVTDTRILMAIASLYVMNERVLEVDRLLGLADKIKKQASMFSAMKSHPRFTTAALLDVNFDNPEEQIPILFDFYDSFRKAKFQQGVFTYIAASILLTNHQENSDPKEIIIRTKDIYQGMKKEHVFLTSNSDYPLATLLAYEDNPDIIQIMEQFYEQLSKNGFRKGNDLQFLSHILSLDNGESVEALVGRSIHVFDSFKGVGIRPKPMYYPVIGMLALLPQEEIDIGAIHQVYARLNSEKYFKWQKDTNLIMAVSFFVKEKLAHSSLAETSLYTTIEMIIQAQQAVMIAVIAGASVTSSNNNN